MSYASRELQQLDEIEDLLDAYAGSRLSPTRPVLARMRAHVLAEAALASATAAAERRASELGATEPSRWLLPRFQLRRRVVALGIAASMTMATGAAVLAAPPGSVFYEARVSLEGAFLPNQADDRLAAHAAHLEQRLVEARVAAASGDPKALQAALAAYAAEVEDALAEVGSDVDLLAHLEAVLGTHVATLTALEVEVPEDAAVDGAIESSQKAVQKIKEKSGSNGGRPGDVPTGPNNAPDR